MGKGERKSGSRKRSKLAEVTYDSDDDEPIGLMLKVKRTEKGKKVKRGLGKEDVDEGLDGLGDTLASFRKKLRAPKRGIGSMGVRGKAVAVESAGQSSSGAMEDMSLAAKDVSETLGLGSDKAGDDVADNKTKTKSRRNRKRQKVDPEVNDLAVKDENEKCVGSRDVSADDEKEAGLRVEKTSDRSCGENMEDSLSASFQKKESNSVTKSCPSVGLLQIYGSRSKSARGLEKQKSVTIGRHKLVSTSVVAQEDKKFESNKHLVSASPPLDSAPDERKTDGDRWSVSSRAACQDGMEGLSSFPAEARDSFPKDILEEQGPTVAPAKENQEDKLFGHLEPDVQKASSHDGPHKVQISKDGLDHDSRKLPNSNCAPKITENNFEHDNDVINNGAGDALSKQSKGISGLHALGAGSIMSPVKKEIDVPLLDDELLDNSRERPVVGEYVITTGRIQFGVSPEDKFSSQHYPSGYSLDTLKAVDSSNDYNNTVDPAKEHCSLSVSSQNEDAEINYRLDSNANDLSDRNHESGNQFCSNQLSLGDSANDTVAPIQKCSLSSQRGQLLCETINHDDHSYDEEASRASTCATLDENESIPEDVISLPDCGGEDNKLSTLQHSTRKAKDIRHGDMAYEGDADWEVLVNDHQFLDGGQTAVDIPSRSRDRLNSSSSRFLKEAVDDGIVAVSAGLKARAVGPVEKIKFKELLKRKGGLEDYLECRNYILHLWNKDISRLLLPSDCGITYNPTDDEPQCTTLLRKVYAFLDQSGYINFGIALRKEQGEPVAKCSYKIVKETSIEPVAKNSYKTVKETSIEDKAGSSFPDGVSFILGQAKDSEEATELKDGAIIQDENMVIESQETKKLVSDVKSQSLNVTSHNNIPSDEYIVSSLTDPKIPEELVDMNVLDADPSSESKEGVTCPVKFAAAAMNELHGSQSFPGVYIGNSYEALRDTEVEKSVIVIGAGPAGLTAARHLQRQGVHVTVLEARNRIGGRVYTDRSSLSVPVDLGASIITGIEADVATERRPDPSSLICAQLGLELSVLNSDCPLYDTVTGQKVPADLDDTLEAEYNSLVDDMVLLVAQNGEHAMKMSLEDGLEYALKKRRMASSGTKIEDSKVGQSADAFVHSRRNTAGGDGPEKFSSSEDILSPLERRVMNWHFAHLEYGCAALLKDVSLPYWNQDDAYGGFGGAHCMIKGGYSAVVDSLSEGISIYMNHVVTDISYDTKDSPLDCGHNKSVKVSTSNGKEFLGDAVLITLPLGCLKAGTIKFTPSLPPWKYTSIQRLGFGVLNKVILEFPEVFWDDSVDYFGATAEDMNQRGRCFMFWNVKKTVGAPVLIALLAGKAAIDGQSLSSSDHVNHALMVLRKLFGEDSVPDPVASIVTDWGGDPFSFGAYSYVAIGASGEDYDMLGRPVESCLFFAGEATCKEHPDTVGGAMISGLREAVRIIDLLCTGKDFTAEGEAMEAAQRHSGYERDEVRDISTRLEAVEISNSLYKNSLEGTKIISKDALLREMFFGAKTVAGRLFVAKELLKFPVGKLKSFAGTKKGLATLNSWILDSLGKDGTQLLRHCVRMLVLVSTDLVAVRSSGIGRTVKDKVCVHTSRDIRYIASQLVSVWLEIFRKGRDNLKLLRRMNSVDTSRKKIFKESNLGKPPVGMRPCLPECKIGSHVSASSGSFLPSGTDNMKLEKQEAAVELKSKLNSSYSRGALSRQDKVVDENDCVMSEEEKASLAATEKARAAALAAAEAYKSYEAKYNMTLQLPKIPSFHKFVRGEHNSPAGGSDPRRKLSDGIVGRQDYMSEIDSRNCRVRDWSIDFSAAGVNLDSSRMSADNLSRRSHSNENACDLNFRENSGESAAVDSSIFAKAWVDIDGNVGIKDSLAIERWQSQAAAAGAEFFYPDMHIKDEEDSITNFKQPTWRHHGQANESSVSQGSINMESSKTLPRGAAHIKQAVVDFAASLLMPLYKEKKIDRDGYKSIMKKTATKVMEKATDAEKAMTVNEFLDFKRRNKIRDFVDKLIEKHMGARPASKP